MSTKEETQDNKREEHLAHEYLLLVFSNLPLITSKFLSVNNASHGYPREIRFVDVSIGF
jgi:hypothetical protein